MIDELLPEIDRIVEEEKQERQLSIAEKQIAQAKAKLENDQAGTKSSAGNNNSQRAWFQTPVAQKLEKVKNKQLYKEALRKSSDIKQKFADVKTRKKQLSHEQESGGRFEKLIDYQVRAAKRKRRQARLRACVDNAPKMAAKNGNQGNASFTSRRSAWNIPFADDDSSEWPAFATEQALTNCVSSHQ
ncbi:hypothetical protein T4E_9626 [Trichinella pseudospiralis]|uniref:Uncharacterized protein n=1 Tax=Trichinella pseudospiralis TaxID=6337 RepID=A0A0V0XLH1_TRIPS|nr:hypothetical protein T4E_9626 [Trichinella pseudospiralis]